MKDNIRGTEERWRETVKPALRPQTPLRERSIEVEGVSVAKDACGRGDLLQPLDVSEVVADPSATDEEKVERGKRRQNQQRLGGAAPICRPPGH